MLAIVIYVVAVLAVVVIGLVTVGRETFAAAQVPRPAVYELDQAAAFVAERLDDRTASRLTPDDVLWILGVDAARLSESADDPSAPGIAVFDDDVAVQAVMEAMDAKRRELIDEADVTAVIVERSRYLEMIGAIGSRADDVAVDGSDPTEDPASPAPQAPPAPS